MPSFKYRMIGEIQYRQHCKEKVPTLPTMEKYAEPDIRSKIVQQAAVLDDSAAQPKMVMYLIASTI